MRMWASGWEGHAVEHYWRLEEWPEAPKSKVTGNWLRKLLRAGTEDTAGLQLPLTCQGASLQANQEGIK